MNSGNGVRIPDKSYFKIGEVCELTGIKQHVLRYWESEFKIIRPQRASSKQRLYRKVDVENFLIIKRLLKEEGFTIPGAKKFLARMSKKAKQKKEEEIQEPPQNLKEQGNQKDFYSELKAELQDIKNLLEG